MPGAQDKGTGGVGAVGGGGCGGGVAEKEARKK